jgi:hypothetical protein
MPLRNKQKATYILITVIPGDPGSIAEVFV